MTTPAESANGLTEIRNPYNGSLAGTVRNSTVSDVNDAVSAAKSAAPDMRAMPAHQRAAILLRAAETLRAERENVAHLITSETAKPIADARLEVDRGIQTLTISAEEAKRFSGEVVPLNGSPGGEGKVAWTRREPLGIIAAITPFNFPLNLVLHKVAPAIASGNVVVLKPAPAAPLTGIRLADILSVAGLPAAALTVVPGGTDVAQALVTHPDVAMVSFTGSVPAGRAIQAAAPQKRVTLELGNAGAVIIEPDADLDRAVARCVPAAFAFASQVCISLQRIYVHHSIAGEFTERFVAAVKELKVGDPFDDATRVSSLISTAAADRVETWIHEAVDAGASRLCGGTRDANIIPPTILADVPANCRISCEEAFGPVVLVNGYDDFAEALAAVNATPFGLQAGVFTARMDRAMQAVETLNMGTVLINEAPNFRMDAMPYGGVKDSGVGREGPRYAMMEMTEPKLVIMHTGP